MKHKHPGRTARRRAARIRRVKRRLTNAAAALLALIIIALAVYILYWYANRGRIEADGERYRQMYAPAATDGRTLPELPADAPGGIPAAMEAPTPQPTDAPMPAPVQDAPADRAEPPFAPDAPFVPDTPPADPVPDTPPEAPAPPEPPAAPAPPEDDAAWDRIRARLGECFPIGTAAILGDDLQVSARLQGDTLILAMHNDFARNMVDRPDVLSRLGALASEVAGRSVRVQTVAPDAPELRRSALELNERLESLRQFDIVKFK